MTDPGRGFDAHDEPPHPPYYAMHCPECFDRLAAPSGASTSPSEPVESREQPRDEEFEFGCPDAPGCQTCDCGDDFLPAPHGDAKRYVRIELLDKARSLLAERDATIRELRARRDGCERQYQEKVAEVWAEMNRTEAAESALAAALAEVSRLREQGAEIRAWAHELKQDAAERAGQSEAYVFAEGFTDRLLAMTDPEDDSARGPVQIVAPDEMTAVLEMTDGQRITGTVRGDVFLPDVAREGE